MANEKSDEMTTVFIMLICIGLMVFIIGWGVANKLDAIQESLNKLECRP